MDSKNVPDKAGRIRQHTQRLLQEIRTWAVLQMELAVVRVWERFDIRLSQLLAGSAVILLGCIALVFVLVAGALWLGPVLGHVSWGFLILGGATGVMAWIVNVIRTSSRAEDNLPPAGVNSEHATS